MPSSNGNSAYAYNKQTSQKEIGAYRVSRRQTTAGDKLKSRIVSRERVR